MAYTASVVKKSVFGDCRMTLISCSADSVSGNIAVPGMSVIYGCTYAPISMSTANSIYYPRIKVNKLEAGTAANGYIGFSGLVSGDDFFLVVYGR